MAVHGWGESRGPLSPRMLRKTLLSGALLFTGQKSFCQKLFSLPNKNYLQCPNCESINFCYLNH